MKKEDIEHLDLKELRATIKEEKKELQKLRFMKTISSVENTAVFKHKRKTIARLMTEANKRGAETPQ